MSDLKLYLKESTYVDSNGVEKTANNLYVKVGRSIIPISVKYFPSKEDGKDKMYSSRMQILINAAEDLPEDAFARKPAEVKVDQAKVALETLPDAPKDLPF